MNDLLFRDHGSIWLLIPVTEAGSAWIADNIPDDAPTWGKAIAVEYVADIAMMSPARATIMQCSRPLSYVLTVQNAGTAAGVAGNP